MPCRLSWNVIRAAWPAGMVKLDWPTTTRLVLARAAPACAATAVALPEQAAPPAGQLAEIPGLTTSVDPTSFSLGEPEAAMTGVPAPPLVPAPEPAPAPVEPLLAPAPPPPVLTVPPVPEPLADPPLPLDPLPLVEPLDDGLYAYA